MIDYKEYTRQMRENSIIVNGILQVNEELWLQIADIIDELAEKQIPKKPRIEYGYGECPNCKRWLFRNEQAHLGKQIPYCKWCGQALDWSEV